MVQGQKYEYGHMIVLRGRVQHRAAPRKLLIHLKHLLARRRIRPFKHLHSSGSDASGRKSKQRLQNAVSTDR